MRFLCTSLAWGIVAGAWLAWQGDGALASRWTPAALVLVHAYALGMLGNAMVGSLVQFLPVAAGSPLPGMRLVPALHVAFNAGVALLLAALWRHSPALAAPAGLLLGGALAVFACMALVAVVRGRGTRTTRSGIALALLALLATVALGVALLAARTGGIAPRPPSWVDLHAFFGVVGWGVGLLAAVGGITVPMLQGTRALPQRASVAWQALLLVALLAATVAQANASPMAWWRLLAMPVAVFAMAVLYLQWRSPSRRNPMLRRSWRWGCCALLAGCGVAGLPDAFLPVPRAVLLGALVLATGLPMLVLGMMFEITGFLGWIELRRRVPRGMRVPGVGSLFPDAWKRWLLAMHAAAMALLLAAVLLAPLAHVAGLMLGAAYAASLSALARCWRDGLRFARARQAGPA